MPLFGAHMSVAGGLHNALLDAQKYGCSAVQMFTKNASQWTGRPISEEDVRLFRRTLRGSGLRHPTSHTSYLINLASPDETQYRRSIEALVDELERAEQLGLTYLVLHPGAHMESGEEEGLQRVARALDEVQERLPTARARILLENTAGQGTTLGHRFEHLSRILELVSRPQRLGICLDTCHLFAAGYPLAPADAYDKTLKSFDSIVGLKQVRLFHVNDSLKPLGSRVDRHAHIGRGHMGLEPFRLLVNDRRFARHPMILETPKEEGEEDDMDRVNLATLQSLVEADG